MTLVHTLMALVQGPGAVSFFTLVALFGGIITGIRIGLFAVGVGHHDTDASNDTLNGVSIATVGVFTLFFGLGGLICFVELGLGLSVSIMLASLLGIAVTALTLYLMKYMMKLQHTGSDLSVAKFIGSQGKTITRIEPNGEGKALLYMDGVMRDRTVINMDDTPMSMDTPVTVTKVTAGQIQVTAHKQQTQQK
jgi:membrane protein implicated in regulation of membrane protease activity